MSRPFLTLFLISALFVGVLGTAWIGQPPSNQELLPHYAKVADAAQQAVAVGGVPWWTDSYLQGSSLTFLSLGALTNGLILLSSWVATPSIGGKLIALAFWLFCPVGMYALVRRLCPTSEWSAFACGIAYLAAPPILLRLGHVEHVSIVLAFALLPLSFWSILAFLEERTPLRALQCAVLNALLVLTYAKIAVLALPVVVIFSLWAWTSRANFVLPPWRTLLLCLGSFAVLAVVPNLPSLREMGFVAQFDFAPFAGWQAVFSSKTLLSWVDRNSFLTGFPTSAQSAVTTPTSYLGWVGVLCVAALFFFRKRPVWLTAEATIFRLFILLTLFAQWLAYGIYSPLTAHLAFLAQSAQAPDASIALAWGLLVLQGVAIYLVIPGSLPGRPWWGGLALVVYYLVPGFRLLEYFPLFGGLRTPHDFFEIPGVFCFAVAAGLAAWLVVREIPHRLVRTTAIAALLGMALADAATVVPSLWRGPISQATFDDFLATQKFLRDQPLPGRVFAYSGRNFYLLTPLLSGRGLVTEAYNGHLMMRGVAELLSQSMNSQESLFDFFNVSGTAYILLDKNDPDTPSGLQKFLRTLRPMVFENDNFAILENPGTLYPAALAQEYVSLDKAKNPGAAALSAAHHGLAAISGRSVFSDNTGQRFESDSATIPLTRMAANAVTRQNAQTITVRSDVGSGWLLLPEARHPDWSATANGSPLEIATSFCGYLAVRLPSDPAEISLHFSPPWWYPACLWTSLAGWIFLGGFLLSDRLGFLPAPLRKSLRRHPTRIAPITKSSLNSSRPSIHKYLVIIPTYNEAGGITETLNRTLAACSEGGEILVIDDASPDGTAKVVRRHEGFGRRIHLLEREGKLGLGTAYRAGFSWALERDFEACLEMDADLSHNPDDIPALLATLDKGADAAIGSRYRDGIRVMNWPQDRLFLSLGASKFVRLLTRLPLTDATSGFKAIRSEALRRLDWNQFKADGYGFQVELHFFLWKSGASLVEVPIVFTERREGATKMSAAIALEALRRVIELGVRGK